MNVILASKSPRRLQILREHGVDPIVVSCDVDESLPDNISMESAVKMLALKKAEACYELVKNKSEYGDSIIIASDTVVYNNEIMGKPIDRADAYRMIKSISGTVHYVATGVALLSAADGRPLKDLHTGEETIIADITKVWCKELSEQEINDYIDMSEPYDKAGAYAIQGFFGRYIDRIEGDYENVVGLPYKRIKPYIEQI